MTPLKFLIVFFCFLFSNCFSQNRKIDSLLKNKNYSAAKYLALEDLNTSKDSNVYYNKLAKIYYHENNIDSTIVYLIKIDSTALQTKHRAHYYYSLARVYSKLDYQDTSIKYLKKAQNNFNQSNDSILANKINYELHFVTNSIKNPNRNREHLYRFYNNAVKYNDIESTISAHLALSHGSNNIERSNDSAIYHLHKAKHLAKNTNIMYFVTSSLGFYYTHLNNDKDSAKYYLDEHLKLAYTLNDKERIFNALKLRSQLSNKNKNYEKAIEFLLIADTISIAEDINHQKKSTNLLLSNNYASLGMNDSAFYYLKLYNNYSNKARYESYNKNRVEFLTWEINREKHILKLKAAEKRKLITYTTYGGITLGLVFLLFYTNIKKQKKIVEKEKNIQQQTFENQIKKQELISIDAMIKGQEKERQRLANDLHDNLGSLLATLKLYVQNLKIKKNRLDEEHNKMIGKTDEIIEEAYQKVRSLAHAKNAGVMASEGLLPAIKNFATKISASNGIVIEVDEVAMDKRLENSLEITVFRIIQELITNVIKHANATSATIHLTHYNTSINIMVEDDGIGFKKEKVNYKEGMGFNSIDKKIESLGGSFLIDSAEKRGTTITIDIPII